MTKITLAGLGAQQLTALNEATAKVSTWESYSDVTDENFPMLEKKQFYGNSVLIYFPRIEDYVYTTTAQTIQGMSAAVLEIPRGKFSRRVRYAPEFLQEPFKEFAAQFGFTTLESVNRAITLQSEHRKLVEARLMEHYGVPASHKYDPKDPNDIKKPVNDELKRVALINSRVRRTFTAPVAAIKVKTDKAGRVIDIARKEDKTLDFQMGWLDFSDAQLAKLQGASSSLEPGTTNAGNYFLFSYPTDLQEGAENFAMDAAKNLTIALYNGALTGTNAAYFANQAEHIDKAMAEWTVDKMVEVVRVQNLLSDSELADLFNPISENLEALIAEEKALAGGVAPAIAGGAKAQLAQPTQQAQPSADVALSEFTLAEEDLPF